MHILLQMLLARGANPLAKDGKGLRPRQLLEKRQVRHIRLSYGGNRISRPPFLHARMHQQPPTPLPISPTQ